MTPLNECSLSFVLRSPRTSNSSCVSSLSCSLYPHMFTILPNVSSEVKSANPTTPSSENTFVRTGTFFPSATPQTQTNLPSNTSTCPKQQPNPPTQLSSPSSTPPPPSRKPLPSKAARAPSVVSACIPKAVNLPQALQQGGEATVPRRLLPNSSKLNWMRRCRI